jgi:hypothetical protein
VVCSGQFGHLSFRDRRVLSAVLRNKFRLVAAVAAAVDYYFVKRPKTLSFALALVDFDFEFDFEFELDFG